MIRTLVTTACAGALVFAGCSKPEPPKLTPKEVSVTSVGPTGLELRLRMEADNPNRVTLSAKSVTGKATLAGKWSMGTVTIDQPVVLPPHVPTMIDVPMTLPWTDVQALGALAASAGPVPYVVDGTVTVGGDKLNVDLPFHLAGTITREQIAEAAVRALPTLPGFAPPPR